MVVTHNSAIVRSDEIHGDFVVCFFALAPWDFFMFAIHRLFPEAGGRKKIHKKKLHFIDFVDLIMN